MNSPKRHLAFTAICALALCLALGAAPARGAPTAQVEQTVQHLIGYVSGSGLTFVRNASEYSPKEAAEHMLKKYRHFRDDIDSPERFIELCATKSLMSGRPYLVIDSQGNAVPTGDWLQTELAAYQQHGP